MAEVVEVTVEVVEGLDEGGHSVGVVVEGEEGVRRETEMTVVEGNLTDQHCK